MEKWVIQSDLSMIISINFKYKVLNLKICVFILLSILYDEKIK